MGFWIWETTWKENPKTTFSTAFYRTLHGCLLVGVISDMYFKFIIRNTDIKCLDTIYKKTIFWGETTDHVNLNWTVSVHFTIFEHILTNKSSRAYTRWKPTSWFYPSPAGGCTPFGLMFTCPSGLCPLDELWLWSLSLGNMISRIFFEHLSTSAIAPVCSPIAERILPGQHLKS